MKYVLLAHLAATLFMIGVIWFVQVVHYPLFSRVGPEKFSLYSEAHSRLTTYVVGPPMLVGKGITGFFSAPQYLVLASYALRTRNGPLPRSYQIRMRLW
jgi:hypothetical protein